MMQRISPKSAINRIKPADVLAWQIFFTVVPVTIISEIPHI